MRRLYAAAACFFFVIAPATPVIAQADIFEKLIEKVDRYAQKHAEKELRYWRKLASWPAWRVGQSYSEDELGFASAECQPSDQYPLAAWCSTTLHAPSPWSKMSALIRRDGRLAYVNYELGIENVSRAQLHELVEQLPEESREIELTPGPRQTSFLLTWGGIEADRLDAGSLKMLAEGKSPSKGIIIDHLNNFPVSAKERLPVYRLQGPPGRIWIANLTSKGRLSIRALEYDEAVARDEAPLATNAPTARSNQDFAASLPPDSGQTTTDIAIRPDAHSEAKEVQLAPGTDTPSVAGPEAPSRTIQQERTVAVPVAIQLPASRPVSGQPVTILIYLTVCAAIAACVWLVRELLRRAAAHDVSILGAQLWLGLVGSGAFWASAADDQLLLGSAIMIIMFGGGSALLYKRTKDLFLSVLLPLVSVVAVWVIVLIVLGILDNRKRGPSIPI